MRSLGLRIDFLALLASPSLAYPTTVTTGADRLFPKASCFLHLLMLRPKVAAIIIPPSVCSRPPPCATRFLATPSSLYRRRPRQPRWANENVNTRCSRLQGGVRGRGVRNFHCETHSRCGGFVWARAGTLFSAVRSVLRRTKLSAEFTISHPRNSSHSRVPAASEMVVGGHGVVIYRRKVAANRWLRWCG